MASEIPCPSCGARIPVDAGVCDLCGYALSDASDASSPGNDDDPSTDEPLASENGVSYCTECGSAFGPTDKFCSECGAPRHQKGEDASTGSPDDSTDRPAQEGTRPVAAELPKGAAAQSPSDADAPESDEDGGLDESAVNRKLGWLVGGAVAVIALLFVGTLLSERGGDPLARTAAERNAGDNIGMESNEGGPANVANVSVDALVGRYSDEPSEELTAEIEELRAEMESEDGIMAQSLHQEIINLYIGSGELGRAAQEQKRLAESVDSPDAWRRTGDLLYSWMEQLGQQGAGEAIPQVAPHVVEAYEAVLDQEPDNLDVRTDMATALLQTQSPMRGVDEINRVLDEDPDHFQARFNKGIMQLYIGRVDEAVAEFEEVKRIVGEGSPYYERADRAITLAREEEERVREEGGAPPQGMPSPTPEDDTEGDVPAFPTP